MTTPPPPPVETRPGELYLGVDKASGKTLLCDADNLVTHGVIVGMTGSGKTGLAFNIIEEALLDGIPSLILDPKGDMGNLLLTFPDFAPSSYLPYVDAGEAERDGITREQLADAVAAKQQRRMVYAGITPDRMRHLVDTTDITIYTPGSNAGVPLNILGSLRAPDVSSDVELMRDEIEAFVSSLLLLADVTSDPVSGREHILLATIIEQAWTAGTDLDLAQLVGQIPNPPFRKLGVFELDTFFPKKDRTALALKLNGLLASPSFSTWLEGEPLDIPAMLNGDPTRCAVIYLAHLSEQERQFVVTLVLSKVVTWFRSESGSESLRALVYMDEVFGYVPPTAEPPSKKPILTILKQARAFGVGLVLATQNPVDLDYKAMSNAGTWLIGRLQTENDKTRILEGLPPDESGSSALGYSELISGLGKREFILHYAKGKGPMVFKARRSMAYRPGPFTREQIRVLMEGKRPIVSEDESAPSTPVNEPLDDALPVQPTVAEGTKVAYLDPAAEWSGTVAAEPGGARLEAAIAVTVDLLYDDTPAKVNHAERYEAVIYPVTEPIDPESILSVDHDDRDFLDSPVGDSASYVVPEASIQNKTFWTSVGASLKTHLAANQRIEIFKNPALKLYSRVGETEEEFVTRCQNEAENAADAAIAKLTDRFETRLDRARQTIAKSENRVVELAGAASAKTQDELLSGVGDLLGGLLGGRSSSNPLGQAAKRRSASATARSRADAAQQKLEDDVRALAELEADLAEEIAAITDEFAGKANDIETVEIPLEKSDIRVFEAKLVWVPVARG